MEAFVLKPSPPWAVLTSPCSMGPLEAHCIAWAWVPVPAPTLATHVTWDKPFPTYFLTHVVGMKQILTALL